MNFKKYSRYFQQIIGILNNIIKSYNTNKKIIIFESDDWGAIRSTKEGNEHFKKEGYNLKNSNYMLDTLETNEDLEELFKVLGRYKGADGKPACFTANVILTNPDFEKIKKSNFEEYHYLRIDDEIKNIKKSDKIIDYWKQGSESGVFKPQLHGREHIQWWKWMEKLQDNCKETLDAFSCKMCGLPKRVSKESISFYEPVYVLDEYTSKNNFKELELSINEGSAFFEDIIGYKSLTTIAPVHTWFDEIEKFWHANGIKVIQGTYLQYKQMSGKLSFKKHFTGEVNKNGLMYFVRNCYFEPSKGDTVEKVLKQIQKSFLLKQPAIISTHRVNYTGDICLENRVNGLRELNILLKSIVEKWPDAIFMSSDEFYSKLIKEGNK